MRRFISALSANSQTMETRSSTERIRRCGTVYGPPWGTTERATKSPAHPVCRDCGTFAVVAPTGVDPVTFRFSVERSTN